MMATNRQDLTTSETPTKRIKTQENSLSTEGKGKLELETNCCGICFSEAAKDDNRISRGYVDSCDHYFCFLCIVEWAKVQSTCPLCKRRFSTIRRPAKPPVFPSDRLVRVPVRDQVHYHFGNATIGPPDPYSDVKCSFCQSSADESLLLLCDLCDSAAHTYCVDLGVTIPEGDWFCRDCTLLKDERNKSEIDSHAEEQSNSADCNEDPSTDEVSVFDIVRESDVRLVKRSSESCLSIHRDGDVEPRLGDDVNVMDSRRPKSIVQEQLTGRTLQRCRDVHNHIRALREDSNSIRRGSLGFSSIKTNCGSSSDSQLEIGVNSVQSSSTSCSSLKSILEDGNPGRSQNSNSREINKAWKMLDVAKSIEKRKSATPKSSNARSSKHLSLERQCGNSEKVACFKKGQRQDFHSVGEDRNKQKPLMLDRENCRNQRFGNGSIDFAISPLPRYHQLGSAQDVKYPNKHDVCSENDGSPTMKVSLGSTRTVCNSFGRPISTGSPTEPAPVASNIACPSIELKSCSPCKKESSVQKGSRQKYPVDSNAKGNYDAKIEIQSLVKLNLKLLTKDKKLETNVFKEVARLATHTILAACGLEQPKHRVHPFPSSVCCHERDNKNFRKSTLMPNSCRECFYNFVNNVVRTIMYEKIGHMNTS